MFVIALYVLGRKDAVGDSFSALRRNPTGWLIDRAFRYTLQFEEQRLDEDSGMAGLPGVSERDP